MNAVDAALASRLQRMQWLATGLMLAMAILFVATSFLRARFPYLNLVWAFSEAALIGGLADWFAVTALFRHPLGIPIPHTAIVPNRKDEIGRALADFIAQHFMVRSVIAARLEGVDLATRLGEWMRRPGNTKGLGHDLSIAIAWLVRGAESGSLGESLKPSLRALADSIPPHRIFATVIDVLAAGNHAQGLIDKLIEYGREQLARNMPIIRLRIRDRSPWWMPKFVDEEIYDQLVGELQRILDEISADPSHEARAQINDRLKDLKYELAHDASLIAKGANLRTEILDHPEVNRFLSEIWERFSDYLQQALSNPDSDIRHGIEQELDALGKSLTEGSELGGRVNTSLAELIVYIVEHYREPISHVISETIAQWDPSATARRIELHIGRDLQFIRINGTLVGGFVGVLLYLGWSAIVA
jgi:uncharacterized membrane-anchored protein YjiN (DUF445 family)